MNKNINFTDMVHSILGESCLSRSIKTVMSESSLSRVQKWRTEHDTAAMATARFNKSKEQAKKEKYELQEWLRAHGYAYTKFDGYYQEQEMPQASREDSLLIVDINDKGNLKQLVQKLGAKYGQESVLFRPKGADSKSILIKTTPKGMGKETPQASGTDYGKRGGAAWSEIGGRAFGDKIDIPGSFWNDEEEEMPQVIVQGSEILYNKRGRACGLKVLVKDFGALYMKRRGSKWEITDISQQNDDQRVWDLVKSSLEKMAKKNPTTFIRMMRNRAYELPKFKHTTITESVTLNGIDVTLQDLKRRMVDAPDAIINDWLNKNDGWDFNGFNEIFSSIEDDTNPQQRLSNATNKIIATVHEWLNLTEQNPQVSDIIRKNLKNYVMQTKNIPTTNKGIRKFVDTIWADQLLPFKQEKTEEIL